MAEGRAFLLLAAGVGAAGAAVGGVIIWGQLAALLP